MNKKIIFVNTQSGDGTICAEAAQKRKTGVLKLDAIYDENIRANGLYSELIESFLKIGKPVPGIVAVRILFQKIQAEKSINIIVIGFPNSEEQLLSWEQEVGEYLNVPLIITHSLNSKYIEQKLKSSKQKIFQIRIITSDKDAFEILKQHNNRMNQRLKGSDWNCLTINSLDDVKLIQDAMDKAEFK